ncbi:helix-turn-helix domain-containing protein [Pedobacter chinensis]|uniref:Helix-turn-helix domain-containing protein n=1 Tax=Pedobacter chinensis TaxID=2282421 RepID=A0A369Q4H9_9SPHI|nr:helix-turn-helix domain-containing protein [Pedobacter chinensis]RDC57829.1 helix-turn-helix domain-containing protein [Pedobacter chinensis]
MNHSIAVKDKLSSNRIIKIAPFKKEVRVTTPHKHNSYFEIIYLSKGGGFHSIDSQRYKIVPPIIFFVRKEQIHYWELDAEPDGYVVIIKRKFVEVSLDKEIKTLLYKLSKTEMLHLKETETITAILQLLAKESLNENAIASPIVEGLLKALLAKLLVEGSSFVGANVPEANLYHSFRELLSQENRLKNSVSYYATELNTSPQNLNAVCRRAANLSAADVLSEFIISEAKRLLIYTDKTISEISFLLSFNDSSHFVKYFKRFTNRTPKTFRIEQE